MTNDGKHSDGDEGHSQCKGGFFVVTILACGKGSMGPAIFITQALKESKATISFSSVHYLNGEGDGNGGQCKGRGQHCVFVDGEHGQHGLHGEGNGDGNGGGHSQCKGGGQHCVFDVVQTVSGLSFSISSLTTKVTRVAKKFIIIPNFMAEILQNN